MTAPSHRANRTAEAAKDSLTQRTENEVSSNRVADRFPRSRPAMNTRPPADQGSPPAYPCLPDHHFHGLCRGQPLGSDFLQRPGMERPSAGGGLKRM